MSKKFYRDVKVIRFCKNCRVEYRPTRGSSFDRLKLCWKCRRPFYAKFYREFSLPWMRSLSPERRRQLQLARQAAWRKWVEENIDRRRAQALASYHKNKAKHKGRRHRATKKTAS